jgi:outer membrane protein assembly factor BamC
VRDFWLENGFTLAQDQIQHRHHGDRLGREPGQDSARFRSQSTLGKVFDSLYSTGERDKFRTRLERNCPMAAPKFTSATAACIEVFNSTTKDATVWQPRPTDPELEVEFLRRHDGQTRRAC